jgi:hypothetical protein
MGEKLGQKQLAFFHFLNKYTKCHANMRINPNKAIAYVLAKISTSLDTVLKAIYVKIMYCKVTILNRPFS